MSVADQIRPFLEPQSVAIVGVPRRTGRASFNVLEIMLDMGFAGRVYPVNPNADAILGVKTYPDVKALPEGIELAVVMTPRRTVPQIVKDCGEKGIRACIVISDGFAEADAEGRALQADVVAAARSTGIRVVGPNSLGVINNFRRFCSTFLPIPRETDAVTLVSQSGGFLGGFSEFAAAKAIDLGNACDVDYADVLEYLEEDTETTVVAIHLEGLAEPRRFFAVARRVARRKPVLVLKAGRSERGARMVASHTGALTGTDQAYDAAFKQASLIRVADVDELGDAAKALVHLPPLRGNRVAILTPTGAGAIMALDSFERYGLELARPSPETLAQLRDLWPPWAPPGNPLDMMTAGILHGYKNAYSAGLKALLSDPEVEAVLCVAGGPTVKTVKACLGDTPKPVVTWVIGRWDESVLAFRRETGYHAVYPSPERALRALALLRRYWTGRE